MAHWFGEQALVTGFTGIPVERQGRLKFDESGRPNHVKMGFIING